VLAGMRLCFRRGGTTSCIVLAALLAACYAPQLPAGAPCADTSRCPYGQSCIAGVCSLSDQAPVDAAPGSRPPIDAAIDTGPSNRCLSTTTCMAATQLGTLSGDTGHPTVTAHGSQGAWLRLRVTENDLSLGGTTMTLRATLTVPAGVDFDVVLHLNPDSDVLECTTALGSPTANGNVKQVQAAWGEDVFDNDSDDSRDVSIEVRPLSAACAPGAEWQLTLAGDV